jgi:hypothetical protein
LFRILIGFVLLLFTMTAPPPPIYTVTSEGDPVVFMVPAFDPTNGPEQSIATQVTVDLDFEYSVFNGTGAQQYVSLCDPGSSQTVELQLEDGTPVGYVTFPLMPVGLVLQPGATQGPANVTVSNVPAIWQTLLGNQPATEGPAGTNIKIFASFPRSLLTTSNGCRVRQTLKVTAYVQVNIS